MKDITNYFSNKLKNYRKDKGFTQKELGEKVGVAHNTISGYESGKAEPEQDMLFKLADVLDVSINDFFPPIGNLISIKQTKMIPVLGAIACGDPILAEENVIDSMAFPSELLPSGKLFFLRAKGDSMTPIIQEDAYVMIRKQEDVETGEIAAVLVNGDTEATLKRVRKLGDTVLLEAINEEYAPYIVNENNPARIIGKAVKVLNDL